MVSAERHQSNPFANARAVFATSCPGFGLDQEGVTFANGVPAVGAGLCAVSARGRREADHAQVRSHRWDPCPCSYAGTSLTTSLMNFGTKVFVPKALISVFKKFI